MSVLASSGTVNNPYTLIPTTAPPTPTPTITYTITPSVSGTGGSISPISPQTVNQGDPITFTFTPDSGYSIGTVTVDGTPVSVSGNSYTITNVQADHTISATFSSVSYTITATAGTGGTISPSGSVSVGYGGSQTFTITANSGYSISDVVVDGTHYGAITSYPFTNVQASHTISATFSSISYTITASAGTGGTISPSGSVSVGYGQDKTFTITPTAGYSISDVVVDGVSKGAITELHVHERPGGSYDLGDIQFDQLYHHDNGRLRWHNQPPPPSATRRVWREPDGHDHPEYRVQHQ